MSPWQMTIEALLRAGVLGILVIGMFWSINSLVFLFVGRLWRGIHWRKYGDSIIQGELVDAIAEKQIAQSDSLRWQKRAEVAEQKLERIEAATHAQEEPEPGLRVAGRRRR